MGQYYRAIVKKQNRRIDVYNRYILRDGKEEYMMAKLTEHSWWRNEFVNAVCLAVYERKEKNRIAWIGDYAETFLKCMDLKTFNGLNQKQIKRLTEQTWDCNGISVPPTDFSLDGLYLINHTKREYFDCTKYFNASVIALNTAIGVCTLYLFLLALGTDWAAMIIILPPTIPQTNT